MTRSGSKIGTVIRVSMGNFLEMYDFMVFGYYAAAIGRAFFPTQNEYASLMLSCRSSSITKVMAGPGLSISVIFRYTFQRPAKPQ